MGKGAQARSSADTIYSPEVTTTTQVDVGISDEALVHILDLVETSNLAQVSLANARNEQLQPYTSFVPETQVVSLPTTGGGGGNLNLVWIGLALAVVGLFFMLRR